MISANDERGSSALKALMIGMCVFGSSVALAADNPVEMPPPSLDRIPQDVLDQMTDPNRAVGSPGLSWPNDTVTVAFNGGSPAVYALIEAAAKEWTSQGGRLSLSFRRADNSWRTWSESGVNPAANIRISFHTDASRGGYWSALGTFALSRRAGQATMNLGDLASTIGNMNSRTWQNSYSKTVVLHEFGHALGLSHEHFHPQCQADIDLQKAVYSLMGHPNGWSYQQALYNLDLPTYVNALRLQPGALPFASFTDN